MSTVQKTRAQLLQDLEQIEKDKQKIQKELLQNSADTLKKLVNDFVSTLNANNFTLNEAESILYPKKRKTSVQKKSESNSDSSSKYVFEKDVVYKIPNTNKTWTGGKQGPRPGGIIAYLDGGGDIKNLIVSPIP